MFNKLYLVHREHNNKDIYWTQIGDDSQYSANYRRKAPFDEKYQINAYFDTISDFAFKNDKEAVVAQRTINNVFKEWTNKGEYKKMQIRINLIQADMINIVTDIVNHLDDDNYLISIMDSLHNRFNPKPKTALDRIMNIDKAGIVYLIECVNDKYKIGMTHDLDRRFNDLKEDERYRAISIVDSFNSEDAAHDEAMLHKLCDMYRQNSNGTINWLQDCLNSELFTKCKEVRNIWNEYKSKSVNGAHARIYMS